MGGWLLAAGLPRSTPEEQGISSEVLLDLVSVLDETVEGMHSVMVVRHGRVIAEGWWAPYDASHNHVLYSLSKSFTATAVGFAVAEGKLSIDDEVLTFFPEDAPAEPSGNLKGMRVRDILTMTAGHQDETSSAPNLISAKSFLAHPVPHKPGTHFKYNTPATFMQSAIVQKVTGQTVLEYLRPRLFEPLAIESPVWDTNFEGILCTLRAGGQESRVVCGYQEWRRGRGAFGAGALALFRDEPVAGAYAWKDDGTCVIQWCAFETPFAMTLTLKFEGDEVVLNSESNVAFGPTKRPQLIGRK